MTILDRIDSTLNGDCPCGATPRPGSPYCSADCEPTHRARDTDTRQTGRYATPMRWRPDLVTAADDTDLIPVANVRAAETVAIAEGRHNANIYRRASNPTVWHLRLDDGHRYVGCDLADMGTPDGIISVEQTARIHDTWQRLERELRNPHHTVEMAAAAYQPGGIVNNEFALRASSHWDTMFYGTRWRPLFGYNPLRYCRQCRQHAETRTATRMTADRRPAAYLHPTTGDFSGTTHLEPCQLCANCRTAFPGPPVRVSLERDHWRSIIRIRLAADGYHFVEDRLDEAAILNVDSLADLIQQTVDRLEAQLFDMAAYQAPPTLPPPIPVDLQDAVRRMISAQVWAATPPNPRDLLRNITVT